MKKYSVCDQCKQRVYSGEEVYCTTYYIFCSEDCLFDKLDVTQFYLEDSECEFTEKDET
jgi:hypothetical protein